MSKDNGGVQVSEARVRLSVIRCDFSSIGHECHENNNRWSLLLSSCGLDEAVSHSQVNHFRCTAATPYQLLKDDVY